MSPPQSVELTVTPDVSVFGEYFEPTEPKGVVLLLHDRGADLDSCRPFADPLQRLQLATFVIDMPGHGLSSGNWQEHALPTVRAAIDHCGANSANVGVVAIGDATSVLFGVERPNVHAIALVQPTLTIGDLQRAESWRSIPQIAMGDPCDKPTQDSMDHLGQWVRAWSLRLHTHYLDDSESTATPWNAQMTNSGAAFIAEQFAYRNFAAMPAGLGQIHD